MIRLWLVLAAMLSILDACGPSPDTRSNFFVVVRNNSTAPDEITIRTALGGVYLTSLKQTVMPGSEAVWVLAKERPDLVEIESTAVTTAWGPPDWRGHSGWVIQYPRGTAEGQDWPPRTE
jgi:hypothetical protein